MEARKFDPTMGDVVTFMAKGPGSVGGVVILTCVPVCFSKGIHGLVLMTPPIHPSAPFRLMSLDPLPLDGDGKVGDKRADGLEEVKAGLASLQWVVRIGIGSLAQSFLAIQGNGDRPSGEKVPFAECLQEV
jgi:hypothetical protein